MEEQKRQTKRIQSNFNILFLSDSTKNCTSDLNFGLVKNFNNNICANSKIYAGSKTSSKETIAILHLFKKRCRTPLKALNQQGGSPCQRKP